VPPHYGNGFTWNYGSENSLIKSSCRLFSTMDKGIIIVNYGMGNLNSVKRKLFRLGINATISSDAFEVSNASKLILPGVGHFKKAVENLKSSGLWDILNETVINKKTPILGICLGLQLMALRSEEGDTEGLGWFNADVVRFSVKDKIKYKVPHMGWNNIQIAKESSLINNLPANSEFYFVHSYHIRSNDPFEVLTFTEYEYKFPSAMEKGHIFGLQFHPEKSHDAGERLLLNFAKL
jgi:imidazole glycerol-phosphate synthase subunit HisH